MVMMDNELAGGWVCKASVITWCLKGHGVDIRGFLWSEGWLDNTVMDSSQEQLQ